MWIVVTGGAGKVGAAVVARLVRAGHDCTVAGRTPRAEVHGARHARCDITDIETIVPVLRGMDAIVHLAAIPGPGGQAPEEIFRVNCAGTFNVYEAAARAGIRRVVTASSINAVGFNYGIKSFPIAYVPVDEALPVFSSDAYSFSKQVTERIGDYAWRRDGISSICLRLPWVAPEVNSKREVVAPHAEKCRASLERLLALPEEERRELIAGWIALRDRCRAERCTESESAGPAYWNADPLLVGRTDFWTRIDERDSAQAVERSLMADVDGCHTLFVNDSHNYTGVPSVTLARLFLPEAEVREEALPGTASLVSIEAARKLIGFEPEHSVGRWL